MEELSFYIIWGAYFISLYFVIFWLLVFLENGYRDRKRKKLKYFPRVSVIIPAYNEGEQVAKTIESALSLDYPKDKLEIIAVNHGSSDNTLDVIRRYKGKIKIITLLRRENERKGAAVNEALSLAHGKFVACLDADSSIESRALHKMLPYFEENDVGAVLPRIVVERPKTFIQKIQYCEYIIVFLYKKMMSCINCLYTTPGPFSLYRKKVIDEVGGFDSSNLTEDMELALKLQKKQYKIIQTIDVEAKTFTPKTFLHYYKQRNRWYKGALLNIVKHKDLILNKRYGDFGMLQMPFILGAAFLSLLTFSVITIKKVIIPIIKNAQIYYYAGLNFHINDFILNIKNFSLLVFSWDKLFWFFLLIFIQLGLIIFAYRVTKKRFNTGGFYVPFTFLFVYSYTIFIAWIGVILDLLKGKKQKW